MALASIAPSALAVQDTSPSPWIVSGEETREDEEIRLVENVRILPGSTLRLVNVTLIGDGGDVLVDAGGSFVAEDSNLTSVADAGDPLSVVGNGNVTFHGTHVEATDSVTVTRPGSSIDVRNATFVETSGILTGRKADLVVRNTTFRNVTSAVDVRDASAEIVDNVFLGGDGLAAISLYSTVAGSRVWGATRADVRGNVVADHDNIGIHFQEAQAKGVRVERNLITRTRVALNLQPGAFASDPTLDANTIVDNDAAGDNQGTEDAFVPAGHDNATVDLGESYLGPNGSTREGRNHLAGSWDTSELVADDPNPELWDVLETEENATPSAVAPIRTEPVSEPDDTSAAPATPAWSAVAALGALMVGCAVACRRR